MFCLHGPLKVETCALGRKKKNGWKGRRSQFPPAVTRACPRVVACTAFTAQSHQLQRRRRYDAVFLGIWRLRVCHFFPTYARGSHWEEFTSGAFLEGQLGQRVYQLERSMDDACVAWKYTVSRASGGPSRVVVNEALLARRSRVLFSERCRCLVRVDA